MISAALIVVALVFPDGLVWVYATINRDVAGANPPPLPTIILRDMLLVLTPIVAFPLLMWRALAADRQAKSAEKTLHHERREAAYEKIFSGDAKKRELGIDEIQRLDNEV